MERRGNPQHHRERGGGLVEGTWFPLPESLLYGNEKWRALPTTAKVMLLSCISEANFRQGEFFRGNEDWQVRLTKYPGKIARNTVKAARDRLAALGFIEAEPGNRGARNRRYATRYTIRPELWSASQVQGHYAQMRRYMFDVILFLLGAECCLAYTYLSAEFWRNRGKRDDHRFYCFLGELQRESGLRNFAGLTREIREKFKFSTGEGLFEWKGYRRLEFRDWMEASEENNGENLERRQKQLRMAALALIEGKTPKRKKKKAKAGVGA